MTYPPDNGQSPYGQESPNPYAQQSYGAQYGAPAPQGPLKVTPAWVNLVTVSIVVAALVAVVLIFTLGSDDDPPAAGSSDSSQVSSTGSASAGTPEAGGGSGGEDSGGGSSASADSGEKPSEAAVKAGIIKILTAAAGATFTDKQIVEIADCASPKLMAEMSNQTLQNYAAGKDVAATAADNKKAQEISSGCATEVVS